MTIRLPRFAYARTLLSIERSRTQLRIARASAILIALVTATPPCAVHAQTTVDSLSRGRAMQPGESVSSFSMLSPADKLRAQALIDSIAKLLPEPTRELFLGVSFRGGNMGGPGLEKPEVQQLLRQLTRLYGDIPQAPRTPAQIEADIAARKESEARQVFVRIALVPASALNGARIVLVRRPDDGGKPLVLLNDSDGTDIEARAGVKAAVAAYKSNSESPLVETRQTISLADFDLATLTVGSVMDDFKTDIPARPLPGFGVVKWTQILTHMPR